MAIVVEEEKDNGGVIVLVGWLVVIVTIIVAGYFVFVRNPGIIEDYGPANFRQTAQVAKIVIKQELFTDPAFTVRQEQGKYVATPGEGVNGRQNPFLP